MRKYLIIGFVVCFAFVSGGNVAKTMFAYDQGKKSPVGVGLITFIFPLAGPVAAFKKNRTFKKYVPDYRPAPKIASGYVTMVIAYGLGAIGFADHPAIGGLTMILSHLIFCAILSGRAGRENKILAEGIDKYYEKEQNGVSLSLALGNKKQLYFHLPILNSEF